LTWRNSLRTLAVAGVSHVGFLESEDRIDFRLEGAVVRVSCTYADLVATVEYGALNRLATEGLVELLCELGSKYPQARENQNLRGQLNVLGLA
jgi:hypothetical protein